MAGNIRAQFPVGPTWDPNVEGLDPTADEAGWDVPPYDDGASASGFPQAKFMTPRGGALSIGVLLLSRTRRLAQVSPGEPMGQMYCTDAAKREKAIGQLLADSTDASAWAMLVGAESVHESSPGMARRFGAMQIHSLLTQRGEQLRGDALGPAKKRPTMASKVDSVALASLFGDPDSEVYIAPLGVAGGVMSRTGTGAVISGTVFGNAFVPIPPPPSNGYVWCAYPSTPEQISKWDVSPRYYAGLSPPPDVYCTVRAGMTGLRPHDSPLPVSPLTPSYKRQTQTLVERMVETRAPGYTRASDDTPVEAGPAEPTEEKKARARPRKKKKKSKGKAPAPEPAADSGAAAASGATALPMALTSAGFDPKMYNAACLAGLGHLTSATVCDILGSTIPMSTDQGKVFVGCRADMVGFATVRHHSEGGLGTAAGGPFQMFDSMEEAEAAQTAPGATSGHVDVFVTQAM